MQTRIKKNRTSFPNLLCLLSGKIIQLAILHRMIYLLLSHTLCVKMSELRLLHFLLLASEIWAVRCRINLQLLTGQTNDFVLIDQCHIEYPFLYSAWNLWSWWLQMQHFPFRCFKFNALLNVQKSWNLKGKMRNVVGPCVASLNIFTNLTSMTFNKIRNFTIYQENKYNDNTKYNFKLPSPDQFRQFWLNCWPLEIGFPCF